MKRAPFLGAAAATLLAGCGGSHVMRAIPGVAQSSHNSSAFAGRLVPATADAIPANVLAQPILGEGWRFDGAVAPNGWMFAKGQTLDVASGRQLFSILGPNGSLDKSKFTLPNVSFGYIIAVAGSFPTSPAMLAAFGRGMTAGQDSLPASLRRTVRTLRQQDLEIRAQRDRAVADARKLYQSGIRARLSGPAAPPSPDLQARIERVQGDARGAALAGLGPANRGRIDAVVGAILGRSISIHQATLQMAAALNGDEANAVLAAFEGSQRALQPGWSGIGHPDPRLEAGRYLVQIAFTQEQLRALRMQSS